MKKNIFLKSAVRKPLKTLVVFLLLAVISFGFMVKLVEYMTVIGETGRLEAFYKPIGKLREAETDEYSVGYIDEGVEILRNEASVGLLDINRQFTGIADGVLSTDTDAIIDDLKKTAYFYGTVTDLDIIEDFSYGNGAPYLHYKYPYLYQVRVRIDKIEIGFEENLPVGEEVFLRLFRSEKAENIPEEGKQYLWRTKIFGAYQMDGSVKYIYQLKDMNDGVYFYPAENGEAAVTDKQVLEDMETRREALYSFQIFMTKDMTRMPLFKESYYLFQGRLLTEEDNVKKNKVCTIRREFAEKRGLNVGDKLKIRIHKSSDIKSSLDELELPGDAADEQAWLNYGAAAEIEKELISREWDGDYVDEEFEIVGIFGALEDDQTWYETYIYIPDSVVPEAWTQQITSDGFSFVLKSPEAEEEFNSHCVPLLEKAGYMTSFLENGWDDFRAAEEPMRYGAAAGVIVFAVILLAVMGFAVVFFTYIHRSGWIIIRLLGAKKNIAGHQLFTASALTAAPAVVLGGLLSWNYGLKKAEETLAALNVQEAGQQQYVPPLYWLPVMCAGVLALWFILNIVSIHILGHRTLLERMQGGKDRIKTNTARHLAADTKENVQTAGVQKKKTQFEASGAEVQTKTGHVSRLRWAGAGQMFRYIFRHMFRTSGRGALAAAVMIAFSFGLGWMQWSIQENEERISELYDTVEIMGRVLTVSVNVPTTTVGKIPPEVIDFMEETGRFSSFSLRTEDKGSVCSLDDNGQVANMYGTLIYAANKPEMCEPLMENTEDIQYAEGYDASVFSTPRGGEDTKPVLLDEAIMEAVGVGLNDTIQVQITKAATWFSDSVTRTENFKIVGSFRDSSGGVSKYGLLMPMAAYDAIMGSGNIFYTDAGFTLKTSQNRILSDFKAAMEEIFKYYDEDSSVELECYINDDELTQAVEPLQKNNSLMRVLYPIVFGVAAAVTAIICILLILQSYKEAAIMRILGTTQLRIGMILSIERILLCAVGLGLGILVNTAVFGGGTDGFNADVKSAVCCFAAGAVASVFSAGIAVRRRPVDLLQVKD